MHKRWNIFRDDNEFNEKTIIGFISFAIMVVYAGLHIVGQFFDFDIEVNEIIYTSFVTVTLGSFGIAEVSKVAKEWGETREVIEVEKPHETETPEEHDDYLDGES